MSSLHSIWLLYRWSRNKLGQVFTFFSSSLQKCSQSLFLLNLIWSFGVSFFYIKNDQSLSSLKWLNTCKSNIDLCNDLDILGYKTISLLCDIKLVISICLLISIRKMWKKSNSDKLCLVTPQNTIFSRNAIFTNLIFFK